MSYIQNLRKYVGHRPIIMPSACILIVNREYKLLLQKRSDNGFWGYPGGSLELGESFEECAIRETYEETGLKCRNLIMFTVESGIKMHYVYPNGDEVYITEIVFICNDFEGKLIKNNEESTELRFFDLKELPENISPINKHVIEKFIDHLKVK